MKEINKIKNTEIVVEAPPSKAHTLRALILGSLVDSLNAGEKVELRGFGSFRLRVRGAREGRNPRTGEQVDVRAKQVVYFRPGKLLKELINA